MGKPRHTEPHQSYRPVQILPKTEKQRILMELLDNHEQIVALGSAGTGKTFLIACKAIDLLKEGEVDRIILTRPNEPAGRSLGYFPGTLEEKMGPWVAEFTSIWADRAGKGFLETALKNGTVEIVPFETMRGRSFERSFIIVDEAQNATPHQLMMLLTRHGEDSILAINGDPDQSDLRGDDRGGLEWIVTIAERNRIPLGYVRFTSDDIVRSGLTKMWVKAFERTA